MVAEQKLIEMQFSGQLIVRRAHCRPAIERFYAAVDAKKHANVSSASAPSGPASSCAAECDR